MRFLSLFSIPLLLCAADSGMRLEGPRLGFLAEEGGVIKPLLGLPGAAWLGPGQTAGDVRELAFAPGGWAVGLEGSAMRPVLIRNLTGPVVAEPLGDLPAGATQLALSPAGSAAVFLFRESGKLAVVTGLPGPALDAWEYELGGIGAQWLRLAVSDGGDAVLGTIREAGQHWAVAVRRYSGFRKIYAAGGDAAIAFLPRQAAALIADPGRNEILLLRSLEGSPLPLASETEGVLRPVDIAASLDGRKAVVISKDASAILILGIEDGSVTAVPYEQSAKELRRLNGNARFRLTGDTAQPLWVLDGDSAPPRLVFVPAGGEQ
jgi:hypothetical protein